MVCCFFGRVCRNFWKFLQKLCLFCFVSFVTVKEDEDEKDIGTFLHPLHLRMNYDVNAWINEEEFKSKDIEWHNISPLNIDNATYFYDRLNVTNFGESYLSNKTLLKLSHHDIDPYYLLDAASVRIARCLQTATNDNNNNSYAILYSVHHIHCIRFL